MRFLVLAILLAAGPQDSVRSQVEALLQRVERLAGADLARETDPGALAASLGHDPGKIFEFVRDLDFHPYSGVLRGARGTLLAASGNDTDRCLLLRDLLERAPAKPAVRFAFAEIHEEQASALVARAFEAAPCPPGARLARTPVEKRPAVAVPKEALEALRRTGAAYAADRESLEAALAGASVALTGVEADGVAARAKALRSHVWLQVQREGRWIDLDPSFDGAAAGWAPVPAAQTSDAIPAGAHHTVGVRLVLERLNGNATDVETIYEGRRPSADLAGEALNVSLLPMGFDVDKFSAPLLRQAPSFQKFQAVVAWGPQEEYARVFDGQGRVFQSKDGKFGGDFGEAAGGRILGAFGRKPGALSALRLEFETVSPGEKPRIETRVLLDRISPASRAKGNPSLDAAWSDDVRFRIALFQSWTLWVGAGPVNDVFVLQRLAGVLVGEAGLPRKILDLGEGKVKTKASELADRIDTLPLPLVELWKHAMTMAQGEFEPGTGLLFPGRPSLLSWKEALRPDDKGNLSWRGGVDLLHAPVGAVAKDPAAAARARFTFGLMLSEEESALMGGGPAPVWSAAEVFRKAREAGIAPVVLRGKVEGATVPDSAAARLRGELEAGNVLVIPREPVEIGGRKSTAWWRVDPATGDCLGIGDTGEGQAASEGVLILTKISVPMVKRCMKFVVCLNHGVVSGKSMQDAGRECMTEFAKDFVKDTFNNAFNQFVKKPINDSLENSMKGMDPRALDLWKKANKAKEYYDKAKKGHETMTSGSLSDRVQLLLGLGIEVAGKLR